MIRANFEEGSQKQWFRKRAGFDRWPDWGVIVIQTSNDGVVGVAESLQDNAWLTTLLGQLQQAFVLQRKKILLDFNKPPRATSQTEPATPTASF